MGHASLAQMEHYGKVARRYLRGDARKVQREILLLLCPDLSAATVEELLPARVAFSKTITSRTLRRSVVPIEDVLFDGAAYEVEATLARRAETGEISRDLHGFSDPIKTP